MAINSFTICAGCTREPVKITTLPTKKIFCLHKIRACDILYPKIHIRKVTTLKHLSFSHKLLCLLLVAIVALSSFSCVSDDPGNVPADTTGKPIDSTSETVGNTDSDTAGGSVSSSDTELTYPISMAEIPEYSGNSYVEINDNVPFFTSEEITTTAYEYYGELDSLGRCTEVHACLGKELLPTADRGNISSVKPSGWHSVTYSVVESGSLYNRTHLIAFMLTGQNANEKNLITGTRYMNTNMVPFETEVCTYVKSCDNHVMYRVTPMFSEDELVARGVLMEALSVEDGGVGIKYNVFLYNVQPDVVIDYATGDSHLADGVTDAVVPDSCDYVLNIKSKKFHLPTCSGVGQMSEKNKEYYTGSREDLIAQGYSPCGTCKP